MRKLIFPLIIISVLLTGCSKEETPIAVEEEEEFIAPETPVAQEVEAILSDVLTAEEFDGKIELIVPSASRTWRVKITLGDRLCFETEITTLGLFLAAFTEAQTLLKEDQGEETLEQVRQLLEYFNENNIISFSLDEKKEGNVILELIKDNETYSADIIMHYSEDDTRYDMNYFYADYISSIIKTLQEIYDRLKVSVI